MSRNVTITVGSKKETRSVPSELVWDSVATRIVSLIKPGSVLAISGPLGAGKTTFIQALARELGVKKTPPSPTFALMRSYEFPRRKDGLSRLVHVDAYRIEDPKDAMALDLDEELADGKSVLAVEWPENLGSCLNRYEVIWMAISHSAE
jgi:tRNA threonylcarbamoyladenosine biosynthesis protein TsaE